MWLKSIIRVYSVSRSSASRSGSYDLGGRLHSIHSGPAHAMPSPGGASLPGENPKSTGNIRLVWGLPSLSKPGPRTGFNHSCQGHRVQSWDPPIFLPRMPRLQAVIILLLAEELDAKRHLVPLAQVHHTCAGVSLTVASSLHAQEMHWNPAPRALHNEFILPNSID